MSIRYHIINNIYSLIDQYQGLTSVGGVPQVAEEWAESLESRWHEDEETGGDRDDTTRPFDDIDPVPALCTEYRHKTSLADLQASLMRLSSMHGTSYDFSIQSKSNVVPSAKVSEELKVLFLSMIRTGELPSNFADMYKQLFPYITQAQVSLSPSDERACKVLDVPSGIVDLIVADNFSQGEHSFDPPGKDAFRTLEQHVVHQDAYFHLLYFASKQIAAGSAEVTHSWTDKEVRKMLATSPLPDQDLLSLVFFLGDSTAGGKLLSPSFRSTTVLLLFSKLLGTPLTSPKSPTFFALLFLCLFLHLEENAPLLEDLVAGTENKKTLISSLNTVFMSALKCRGGESTKQSTTMSAKYTLTVQPKENAEEAAGAGTGTGGGSTSSINSIKKRDIKKWWRCVVVANPGTTLMDVTPQKDVYVLATGKRLDPPDDKATRAAVGGTSVASVPVQSFTTLFTKGLRETKTSLSFNSQDAAASIQDCAVFIQGEHEDAMDLETTSTVTSTMNWGEFLAVACGLAIGSVLQKSVTSRHEEKEEQKSEEPATSTAAAAATGINQPASEEKGAEKKEKKFQVAPLFAGGLVRSEVTNTGTIAMNVLKNEPAAAKFLTRAYQFCMCANTPALQPYLRGVLAVGLCHAKEEDVLSVLRLRWTIDWAPLFVGDANDAARKRASKLCDFVVKNVAMCKPDTMKKDNVAPVLAHLRSCIFLEMNPNEIKDQLSEIPKNAESRISSLLAIKSAIDTILAAKYDRMLPLYVSFLLSWFGSENYLKSIEGAGKDLENKIRSSAVEIILMLFQKFVAPMASGEELPLHARVVALKTLELLCHPFDIQDIVTFYGNVDFRNTVLRIVKLAEKVQLLNGDPTTMNRLIPCSFSHTQPGVQITATQKGRQVDRTSMDTLSLRSVNAWHTAFIPENPLVYYFEVRLSSDTILRSMIGLAVEGYSLDEFDSKSCSVGCYYVDSRASFAFGPHDVVGCGLDVLNRVVFFTLNGLLVVSQPLGKNVTTLFPVVTYSTRDKSTIFINFGEGPYLYDPRQLHPAFSSNFPDSLFLSRYALCVHARVSSATIPDKELSAATLFQIVQSIEHISSTQDGASQSLPLLFTELNILSDYLNGPSADDISEEDQSLILRAVEATIHDARSNVQSMGVDILNKLIAVCPDLSLNEKTASQLFSLVLKLAPTALSSEASAATWYPRWMDANQEHAQINGAVATVKKRPEGDEGHGSELAQAVGQILPPTGVITFSVFFNQIVAETRSVGVFGHFYVGVTTENLAAFSSPAWKCRDVPLTWAIQSRENQLLHADVAVLGGERYLFGSGSTVKVTCDRSKGTISFSNGERVWQDVFNGVPSNVDLRPFVQIVGPLTSATILPGTTQGIPAPVLAGSMAATALRSLLCLEGSSDSVARLVCDELKATHLNKEKSSVPWGSLTVLGAFPDSSRVAFNHDKGSTGVKAGRIIGSRALVYAQGYAVPLFVSQGDLQARALSYGSWPAGAGYSIGLRSCVNEVCKWIFTWCGLSLPTGILSFEEETDRESIVSDEAAQRNESINFHREHMFSVLHQRNSTLMSGILQAPPPPLSYTFSRSDSSLGTLIPAHYEGRLLLTSNDVQDSNGPYVGIANEPIPSSGISDVCIRLDRDWQALMPFPPGENFMELDRNCYVGVCLESYRGEKRRHTLVKPPDMWACPAFDDQLHHFPHSCSFARNHRLIFSKDTVRLHINRERNTMEVFISSFHGGKERTVGLLYDNLPPNVALFPFVQLGYPLSAALFVSNMRSFQRTCHNYLRYLPLLSSNIKCTCDGCVGMLVESTVSAPNWFRCNQCADFDLCINCFNNHLHAGHTFTRMSKQSMVSSPVCEVKDPKKADVETAPLPLYFVLSQQGVPQKGTYNGVFEATGEKAVAIWGILRRKGASAASHCCAVFRNASASTCSPSDAPQCYVGISKASKVASKDYDGLCALMQNPTKTEGTDDIVALSNFEGLLQKPSFLDVHNRRVTTGFNMDDSLAFLIQENEIRLLKNGTHFATVPFLARDEPLYFFVIMSHGGYLADVRPTFVEKLAGKVAELSSTGKVARVAGGPENIWLPVSELRTPLTVPLSHSVLLPGMTVYVSHSTENTVSPARVMKVGDSDKPITVSDGLNTFDVLISALLVEVPQNVIPTDEDTSPFPEVKKRLRRFYKKYAPEKTEEQMDNAIRVYQKHKQGFKAMFDDLVKKYGPEPVEEGVVPPAPPNVRHRTNRAKDFTASRMMKLLIELVSSENTASMLDENACGLSKALSILTESAETWASKKSIKSLENATSVSFSEHSTPRCRKVADTSVTATTALTNIELSLTNGGEPLTEVTNSNSALPLTFDVAIVGSPAVVLTAPPIGTLLAAGTWKMTMRTKSNYKFDATLNIVEKSTEILFSNTTIHCKIDGPNIDNLTNTCSLVLMTDQEVPQEVTNLLERRSQLKVGQKRLPSAIEDAVFMSLQLSVAEGLALSGRFVLPSGNYGNCKLVCMSESTLSSFQKKELLPCIDDTHPLISPPNSAADLDAYVDSLALSLRCSLIAFTGIPTIEGFVREMALSKNPVAVRKIILDEVSTRPQAVAALLKYCVAAARCLSADPKIATFAASLIPTILDVTGQGSYNNPLVFTECLISVLAVAHRYPLSTSVMSILAKMTALQSTHASKFMSGLFAYYCARFAEGSLNPIRMSLVASIFSPMYTHAPYLKSPMATAFPLRHINFLAEVGRSVQSNSRVPAACDTVSAEGEGILRWIPITKETMIQGNILSRGQVRSSTFVRLGETRKLYFEAIVPPESRLVIGICVSSGKDRIGSDAASVGFDGAAYYHKSYYYSCGAAEISAKDVLCCGLNASAKTVQFGVNEKMFEPVAIPSEVLEIAEKEDSNLYLCAMTLRCSGVKILSNRDELKCLPRGYEPFEKIDDSLVAEFDVTKRSECPPKSAAFYEGLCVWLAQREQEVDILEGVDAAMREKYASHVLSVERCFTRCLRFLDFSSNHASAVSDYLPVLKMMVHRDFRVDCLCSIPPINHIANRLSLPQVSVCWYLLSSTKKRSAEEALQNTVVAQLFHQMGSDPAYFERTPMFVTSLMMDNSGHTPIDAGGPYNSVFALLSEELMYEGDDPDFYKNPLFNLTSTPGGKWLVPQRARCSPLSLSLYRFFGKIMGYCVRSKMYLAIELSPFVWNYLTETPQGVSEFYNAISNSLSEFTQDLDFLSSESPERDEYFPDLDAQVAKLKKEPKHRDASDEELLPIAAENSLLHSLDLQLEALRTGLWESVGRQCCRVLRPKDLERMICGEAISTYEQVEDSITSNLDPVQTSFFWEVMKGLTPAEWANFFYFCTARRRYPLSKKITLVPGGGSPDHIPSASTCFNQCHMPRYSTAAEMKEKLLRAIQCIDMQLA